MYNLSLSKNTHSLTDITSSFKNKPRISRKNHDKGSNFIIKTIEGNRRLRVRVMVRVWFILFYSEFTLNDP